MCFSRAKKDKEVAAKKSTANGDKREPELPPPQEWSDYASDRGEAWDSRSDEGDDEEEKMKWQPVAGEDAPDDIRGACS